MKQLIQILNSTVRSLLNKAAYDCVCDNCSYYNDPIVDDQAAYVPHVKSQKGWIEKYVSRRLVR